MVWVGSSLGLRVAAVGQEIAVEGQLLPGQPRQLGLQGGVAAGVHPGVVVGEAVDHLRVGGVVTEQPGGAVVDAPLPGVEGVAHGGGLAVVIAGPALGELDADLHGASGGDRVQLGQAAHVEQLARQGSGPEGSRVALS